MPPPEKDCIKWYLSRTLSRFVVASPPQASAGANLHLGRGKPRPVFEAHAWVQVNGTVINDTGEVHESLCSF